jgi:hypothetical protein
MTRDEFEALTGWEADIAIAEWTREGGNNGSPCSFEDFDESYLEQLTSDIMGWTDKGYPR